MANLVEKLRLGYVKRTRERKRTEYDTVMRNCSHCFINEVGRPRASSLCKPCYAVRFHQRSFLLFKDNLICIYKPLGS